MMLHGELPVLSGFVTTAASVPPSINVPYPAAAASNDTCKAAAQMHVSEVCYEEALP